MPAARARDLGYPAAMTTTADDDGRPAVVIRAYEKQYLQPICVRAGEIVNVEREDDGYPGWWWCTAADGLSGWVPEELLEREGPSAKVTEDYSAAELSVAVGQEVVVQEIRRDWARVRGAGGAEGWVPLGCLRFL